MNSELIFNNIKKMLEYRLNSQSLKFNILFKDYDDEKEFQKIEMKIKSDSGYNAEYYVNNKLYKIAYLDLEISKVKSLVNDEKSIILYIEGNRKIQQLFKSPFKCEFLKSNLFLTDYKSNVYFTHCCKSSETQINNIQYIASDDFTVQYNGLKDGDVMLAVNIIDPTLILPQLRIVKKIDK